MCRSIARRQARNFYYGFLALPRQKRDAMCAVYAFMRRADDIADDESIPVERRRTLMAAWIDSWHTDRNVAAEDAKVFLAVRDVQQRFGVPDELLDLLVQGTAMDLLPEPPAGVVRISVSDGSAERHADAYQTMEALEQYCYLVASVVGLTTIRIFGFEDSRAEACAEELGKAFQFTNVLRDVKEDSGRGRLYLPLELLEAHGTAPDEIFRAAAGKPISPDLRSAMAELADRAEKFYASAGSLIPLLAADSRPAMRVLVGIYHALLREIRSAHFEVFSRRLRVSTPRKILILSQGLLAGKMSRGLRA